ncbi:MAG: pilus assembly protein PilM [Planctomycetota bacterium]
MKSVWGLDISKSSLKAVRLQMIRNTVIVTDFDIIEYAPSANRDEVTLKKGFQSALNLFRSRHKIEGETIVVSPPFHSFFNKFINVPSASGDDLINSIKEKAQQHLPFAIEKFIWSYQKTERSYQPGEDIEVVFLAIKRDSIEQFVSLLSSNGLQVDIIQFAPLALYNYIMVDYASLIDGKNFVILDIGANNTNLILVERSRFWIRNLPICGDDITKTIQQKLGISFDESEQLKIKAISKESSGGVKIGGIIQGILKDLTTEINRFVAFYKSSASGHSVNFDKIILMGNASRTIYLEELFSQHLKLTPLRLTGLNKIILSENIIKKEFYNKLSGLGVALGLGLQGIEQAPNRINLLPPEIIQRRTVFRRKPFIAAISVILILIVLFLHLSARETLHELTQANKQANEVIYKAKEIESTYRKVSVGDDGIKLLENLSNIGWQKNIWIEILNSFNKLKVFDDSNLAPRKGYMEMNDKTDEQWLKEQELKKIWLLEIKMGRNAVEGIAGEVINIEIICGIVARQKSNGEFDSLASKEFVKEALIKPLLDDFKILESSPVLLDNKPISELKTDMEINELPLISYTPKYYRFKVNLQILLLHK